MAPTLRKRETTVKTVQSNGTKKVVKKTTVQSKRKAADDSSPGSLKKQKPDTKITVEQTSTPIEAGNDDRLDLSESEDEDEGQIQALAKQIDAADEDPQASQGNSTFKPGQDVGKIPKPAISKKTKSSEKDQPGVLYIGRIPHGFYEHEMKQYFAQFGPINHLRLSRNKKTGASKHFAFVEFSEASTAEVVAKTMDNYLLFGHILKCKLIPNEKVHSDLFKGANRRFKKVPWNKMFGQELAKPKCRSSWESKVIKEEEKRKSIAAKLAAIGYDYEMPTLKAVTDVPMIDGVDAADSTVQVEGEDEKANDQALETQQISKKRSGKAKKARA